MFYVLSLIAAVWFFIWSIADFADANGWVMVSNHSANGRGAATFFAVITSLLMLGISILTVINLVMFYKRPSSDSDDWSPYFKDGRILSADAHHWIKMILVLNLRGCFALPIRWCNQSSLPRTSSSGSGLAISRECLFGGRRSWNNFLFLISCRVASRQRCWDVRRSLRWWITCWGLTLCCKNRSLGRLRVIGFGISLGWGNLWSSLKITIRLFLGPSTIDRSLVVFYCFFFPRQVTASRPCWGWSNPPPPTASQKASHCSTAP